MTDFEGGGRAGRDPRVEPEIGDPKESSSDRRENRARIQRNVSATINSNY